MASEAVGCAPRTSNAKEILVRMAHPTCFCHCARSEAISFEETVTFGATAFGLAPYDNSVGRAPHTGNVKKIFGAHGAPYVPSFLRVLDGSRRRVRTAHRQC